MKIRKMHFSLSEKVKRSKPLNERLIRKMTILRTPDSTLKGNLTNAIIVITKDTKLLIAGREKLLKESLECETCILGKQVRTRFPKFSENRYEKLLEQIHSDVCGPMRINSFGGARYFVTFIDEKSRWVEVRFLKNKSDVKSEFLKFKSYVETQQEKKIKILRTDNGLEYCGKEFTNALEQAGIRITKENLIRNQENASS